ncbi:MAG: hypothetical protein HY651_06380 [Acidobacteria bacterium]|nr:hypothetical protein [Acidobacteriota bacterium]
MYQVETNPNHKYFAEQVGQIAFIFLANLYRFNLDSRRHMAAAEFNGIYKPLERREGDLAALEDENRRQLMDLVTLDILTKTFMAIEDLGKILLTTGKSIKDMPNTILDAGQNDSLNAIATFEKKSEQELYKIFPFLHRRIYGLDGAEAEAVERYWFQTAGSAKRMLAFLKEFIDRHVWAYNKYKHGIPIILAMNSQPICLGINGAVPIFTSTADLSRVKIILTGDLIAEKLIGLTDSIVGLSKALVERRLQQAELGGTPPLLLAHTLDVGATTEFKAWGFGKFDNDTEQKFNAAFQRVMAQMKRTKIEATLNVQTDPSKLQDLVEFYRRDWRVA